MELKIEAPERVLRYLAFLVQDYFASNPAVDDGQLDPIPAENLGALAGVGRGLLEQMRAQGVEPSEYEPS